VFHRDLRHSHGHPRTFIAIALLRSDFDPTELAKQSA
jgi:hypothetical protein